MCGQTMVKLLLMPESSLGSQQKLQAAGDTARAIKLSTELTLRCMMLNARLDVPHA